jgi:hypothetical protein
MKDADLCCVNNNQKLRVKAPARPALRSSQCHDNVYADYGTKAQFCCGAARVAWRLPKIPYYFPC